MTTGYSHTSLVEKLGIQPETKIAIINAPASYTAQLSENLPRDVSLSSVVSVPSKSDQTIRLFDFIQLFTTQRTDLQARFPVLLEALSMNGMLWISYPRKTARIPSDLNEDLIREIGLMNGVLEIKVAALDEVWSGLKFVRRLKDRK